MPTMIQGEPITVDDLEPYQGTWVAIRDGRVIANALSAVEVWNDPYVGADDLIMPVPTDSKRMLIL